jgi:serine/threonine protein kinase
MSGQPPDAKSIFLQAVEQHAPAQWPEFLDEACGGDPALRRTVEKLLEAHRESNAMLDRTGAVVGFDIRQYLAPCDSEDALGRIGPYHVTGVVGRGRMGVVLKARDANLDRVVAIKMLAPELAGNGTARKRFLREAQAGAAVAHQHVVAIYAVHESRLPYLVMEYVDGQSVQERIEAQGHLELRELLRIGTQTASGLAAAHAQGLIHRDIKPSNILLENRVQRVRITDFGLARAVDDVGVTRTGETLDTPQYRSPEQALAQAVDTRSDLFSLGCVLYAMCTGCSPFGAQTTAAAVRRVCEEMPRPIRDVNADIPAWLVELIDRLLQKDPDNRIQTATEAAERLGRHLAHVQDPNSTPPPEPLPKLRTRRRSRIRRWFVGP